RSETGSVIIGKVPDRSTKVARQKQGLPTRLFHAGNHAVEGQTPETDAAQLEFPQHGPGPAAQLATVLDPRGKFRLAFRLRNVSGGRHLVVTFQKIERKTRSISCYFALDSSLRNGMPRCLSKIRPSSSFPAVVTIVMFIP